MVQVRELDFDDPAERAALCDILDAYAREPAGQGAPLDDYTRRHLADGLAAHPTRLVLLAFVDDAPVGVAVCFFGFSTFAARPLLNLHDFAVLPAHRGGGVGAALLDTLEARARERGCCKVTLEVHDTNTRAQALYRRRGFGPWSPGTRFVSKPL